MTFPAAMDSAFDGMMLCPFTLYAAHTIGAQLPIVRRFATGCFPV
jgi:hypothetical protein